ncbi:MAG TPA: Asp-tRNA(Asn)/Glu-tRNA(Gln) amidotransferase subunit GatA [Planctomycetota bacterium]|nr:Asp-tRNA(Asn)/Glu-tRNA(Gln) amidotransferase subunit GatA [Planctomycetota bacterium]
MPSSTAVEIAKAVQSGARSAVDVVSERLAAIEKIDGRLGAFLGVDRNAALAEAREADRRVKEGERLPLAGVPVAIKDNLCCVGYACTCGSRMLETWRPPYDATVVARLKAAGAVVIGKTNLDEFAMGSSCENSAYKPTRNPWDLARTPGGSSGGSAAAVAAALAPLALGSDTGGSIRQPAAFSGVVGFKPTYGRVSRYGLVAFASSLDQIGPFARTVEDAALCTRIIAGRDERDATSADQPLDDLVAELKTPVRGLTIGLPDEYFGDAVDDDVKAAVTSAAKALEKAGVQSVRVKLPHTPYAIPVYYIVATAEASSNLARFDGVHYGRRAKGAADVGALFAESRREGFGAEVRRRILLGTYCLSSGYYDAYYDRALRVRSLIARDFSLAFGQCDAVLCPVTPTPAFKIGEKSDDPLKMYLSDVLTGACNLAGLPGLTVPCGFATRDGAKLPVGAQLIGPRWSESLLFRLGRAIEASAGVVDVASPLAEEVR